MRSLFNKLKSGDLLEVKDERDNSIYCYWASIRVLGAFKKVIIMTYMFYGQELRYYLDIHKSHIHLSEQNYVMMGYIGLILQ